jgi:molybdopterin synthase catalytic subunit
VDLQILIDKIKKNPEYDRVGMILCHNGVVRGTSRDGRMVSGLKISVNHLELNKVISENKKRSGVIDILVEINENKELSVGDDVMFLVVAGDIRENVIRTLEDTLNRIKTTVTKKTEYYL